MYHFDAYLGIENVAIGPSFERKWIILSGSNWIV
jgi:hypothetical protein